MKTILITGATGFLGSALAERLCRSYHVLALKRPSSDLSRLSAILPDIQLCTIDENLPEVLLRQPVHAVIHTAVEYGRGQHAASSALEANVLFPIRLLEMLRTHPLELFIHTDTFFAKHASSYEYLFEYRLSKEQIKQWLKKWQSVFPVVSMRLEHLYGVGDDGRKFLPAIIKKIVGNETAVELTPGEQRRDFLYVSDAAAAFEAVLENASEFEKKWYEYEVGSGKSHSIKQVLQYAKEYSGSGTALQFGALPYRQDEMHESCADTSALQKLGWKPEVDLHTGIRKMVDSFRQADRHLS